MLHAERVAAHHVEGDPTGALAGYETDLDDHAWLRVGLGGMFNTAGLVSMDTPQTVDTSGFGFTQRMQARYGTHDRIALTPASTFSHGERWDGERHVPCLFLAGHAGILLRSFQLL